jgi:hypothetical protein
VSKKVPVFCWIAARGPWWDLYWEARRELAAPAGGGHTSGRGVAAEHSHPKAHLTVPSAWPVAARGDPTTCPDGHAHSTSDGGALRQPQCPPKGRKRVSARRGRWWSYQLGQMRLGDNGQRRCELGHGGHGRAHPRKRERAWSEWGTGRGRAWETLQSMQGHGHAEEHMARGGDAS